MKSSSLDKRVFAEGRFLLKAAKVVGNSEDASDVARAATAVEAAIGKGDVAMLRAALPALDAAVDAAVAESGKSIARENIESIGVAVIIALLLRAFVLEAFKIPSSSMIPTLEIGDHIFVNKAVYGPRIPWTEDRLFHLRGPERGEVVVFKFPCEPDKDFIKRVVAVAGDRVEVRCGLLHVNGKPVDRTELAGACSYDDYKKPSWQKVDCRRYREKHGNNEYDIVMDIPKEENPLSKGNDFPKVWSVRDDEMPDLPKCEKLAPVPATFVRTAPSEQAGDCGLQLHYVVPPEHIFVMGDNRDNSHDSRIWGPAPLSAVKGKAMFIWWSHGGPQGGFVQRVRTDRMGSFVHR